MSEEVIPRGTTQVHLRVVFGLLFLCAVLVNSDGMMMECELVWTSCEGVLVNFQPRFDGSDVFGLVECGVDEHSSGV